MNAFSRVVLGLCSGLLLAACAAPPLQSVPGGELSAEGLQRMSGSTFDEVWVRPGLKVSGYRGIVLEPTSVAYREVGDRISYEAPRLRADRDGFPIPADQRARIEKSFQDRLAQALDDSPEFRRVAAPTSDTLSLRAVLVDFVSRVPPEGSFGRTETYVSSVGEATLVIELWDSERDLLLARAVDHRRAGPTGTRLIRANHVTSWAEIDRQMQRWAVEARELVNQLYQWDGE
jgi:hypothetical protein